MNVYARTMVNEVVKEGHILAMSGSLNRLESKKGYRTLYLCPEKITH